jgi:hypothetical protein
MKRGLTSIVETAAEPGGIDSQSGSEAAAGSAHWSRVPAVAVSVAVVTVVSDDAVCAFDGRAIVLTVNAYGRLGTYHDDLRRGRVVVAWRRWARIVTHRPGVIPG